MREQAGAEKSSSSSPQDKTEDNYLLRKESQALDRQVEPSDASQNALTRVESALRESELTFRLLFEKSVDPGLLLDGDIFIDCNNAALDMLHCSQRSDILGLRPSQISPDTQPDGQPSRDKEEIFTSLAQAGESSRFEWVHRTFDGEDFWVDVSLTAIPIKGKVITHVAWHDITGRKRAEKALSEVGERYRAIFDNAVEGIFQITPRGRYLHVNPALARMYGYGSPKEMMDDIIDIGRQQYVDPEDRSKVKKLYEHKGFIERFQTQLYKKTGDKIWISVNARAVRDEDGVILYYEGTAEDITQAKRAEESLQKAHNELEERVIERTAELAEANRSLQAEIAERKRIEEKLQASNQRLFDIIEFLPDATFVINKEKKVIAWNKAIEEMTGVEKEDILGRGDYEYAIPFYGEKRPILIDLVYYPQSEIRKWYNVVERRGNALYVESFVPKARNGKGAYYWGIASLLVDREGNIVGAIETLRDITEQREAKEAIRNLAFHDPLTGLPNRLLFKDRLALAISNGDRNARKIAVMFLDLDRFKHINDTFGHDTGDLLLKATAQRLTAILRKSDTIARMGGDEFLLVLPEMAASNCVDVVAEKILRAFSEPFTLNGHKISVTTSIGIAVYPHDGKDIETLLKMADMAMYEAKKAGRNKCRHVTDGT